MSKMPSIVLCVLVSVALCEAQQSAPSGPKPDAARIALLEEDLALLDEQIRSAQAYAIEYARLHDIHRVRIRADAELQRLKFVVGDGVKAGQELLVLEARHPFLSDTNAPASVSDADALREQYAALKRVGNVLEESVYKWQAKNVLATRRELELKHLQDRVKRFEETYADVADRLHAFRMKHQLKSLQNNSVEDIGANRAESSR